MVHQVVNGEGLQIWRVTVNILNKQSWTTDKRWSSSIGFGKGVTISHCKMLACYEMLCRALDLWALVNMVMNLQVP
jgi:hypothetical protein